MVSIATRPHAGRRAGEGVVLVLFFLQARRPLQQLAIRAALVHIHVTLQLLLRLAAARRPVLNHSQLSTRDLVQPPAPRDQAF